MIISSILGWCWCTKVDDDKPYFEIFLTLDYMILISTYIKISLKSYKFLIYIKKYRKSTQDIEAIQITPYSSIQHLHTQQRNMRKLCVFLFALQAILVFALFSNLNKVQENCLILNPLCEVILTFSNFPTYFSFVAVNIVLILSSFWYCQ